MIFVCHERHDQNIFSVYHLPYTRELCWHYLEVIIPFAARKVEKRLDKV